MRIKKRKKRCKWCNALFQPIYSTLQKACSPACAMSLVEQTKKDARDELKKAEKARDEQKSLSRAKDLTKKVVHEYIRERDKGKPCISCGQPWNPDHQSGHFHKAELYEYLRYHYHNINNQCVGCNIHKDGNLDEYIVNLPNRIGKEAFDKLQALAEREKRLPPKKWTRHELQEIRNEVKLLMKGLKS